MSGGASFDTKFSRPTLGFPADLPAPLVALVNDLAARDADGEPVPALVGRYLGADGTPKRLVWLPRTAYAAALVRLGLAGEDGGDA